MFSPPGKDAVVRARSRDLSPLDGMADATTRLKEPTDNWILLMAFAARGPALSVVDIAKLFETPDRLVIRKKISDVNTALRRYFAKDERPIHCDRIGRYYMPLLAIRQDSNTYLEDWLGRYSPQQNSCCPQAR